MKYGEFIKEVQDRGHMDSREEAEKATRATLEALAERLAGGEPHDLASQLPPELAPSIFGTKGRRPAIPSLWTSSSSGLTRGTRAWIFLRPSTMPE